MHKGFYTDVMQHRPALFATMLVFNGLTTKTFGGMGFTASQGQDFCMSDSAAASDRPQHVSSQDHCLSVLSEIQGLSAASIASLAASPVVQRHMQGTSLPSTAAHPSNISQAQSHTPFFWDFAEESRRLIFLSPQELSALMQRFGIAINAKYYAHIINRADVLTLQRALGADMYAYGLVRGRFQVGTVANFFRTSTQSLDVETILHNIQRDGDVALGLCIASWPHSLQERLCSLLGRTIAPIHDVDVAMVRGVWFILKKLLLREVAPQWAPCFD